MPPFHACRSRSRHPRPACAIALALAIPALALSLVSPAGAVTPNGRLQIFHLDVGQGDGAVIITPLGQVVMIDCGVYTDPTPANGVKVRAQLQALGVTQVDCHFASHYHADHIGLFGQIFGRGGIATLGYAWDRAESYTTSTYTAYRDTAGARRRTLVKGQVITLDSLSAHPVTIKCVDLAGAGTGTTDENGKCLVLKVSYGAFDELFGGDLISSVESVVASAVGPVEAYKVHHHGSSGSSNATFLAAIQPKIGIVSCGTGNTYGHPTSAALTRLHAANVKTYWTETGTGVAPNPAWDKVSNNHVIVSATWAPGGVDTVKGNGFADTFTNSGTAVTFTLTASAEADGSISPSGAVVVPQGGDQTFTITPDAGFNLAEVLVDGVPVATMPSYTFSDVGANHTISASFASAVSVPGADGLASGVEFSRPVPNPFTAVMRLDYVVRGGDAHVDIDVFDVGGRRVQSLAHGVHPAGRYAARWDGLDSDGARAKNGIYFVRSVADGVPHTMRVILMR